MAFMGFMGFMGFMAFFIIRSIIYSFTLQTLQVSTSLNCQIDPEPFKTAEMGVLSTSSNLTCR